MRAKFIYEKFTKESDPIKDLNIGLNVPRDFKREEMEQWIVDHLPFILGTDKIPKDIIRSRESWFPNKYDTKIGDYIIKYISIDGKKQSEFSWYRSGIQKILKEMGFESGD